VFAVSEVAFGLWPRETGHANIASHVAGFAGIQSHGKQLNSGESSYLAIV